MHIINSSDVICDVINRGMVRYVQESANLNERIIKFRVVASFDTISGTVIIVGDIGGRH